MISIDSVWQAYHHCPTTQLRNQLVEHYDPLASSLAFKIGRKIASPVVALDDLQAVARIALMKAIDGFDLARGLQFATYGGHIIRGAILDELRKVDPVSRHYRRLSNALERERAQLTQQLGRPACDRDLANHLHVTEDHVAGSQAPLTGTLDYTYRPDANRYSATNGRKVNPRQIADGQLAASQTMQRADLHALVLRGMSDREKQLVTLYYYEGLPMRAIAEAIGVTESRVSQMHSQLLVRLRARLADRAEEFSL